MIKSIFFDLDGVLTTNAKGALQTCEYLSTATNIDIDTLLSAHQKVGRALGLGEKTYKDIWNIFCSSVGKNIHISLLQEAFLSTPINQPIRDIVVKLKGNNYKIGIITDNPKERFQVIAEKYRLEEMFDTIIISGEVGSFKDDRAIFEEALKKTGTKAEESIFIDNSSNNLEIPSMMGFKTFLHDDTKNDCNKLADRLRSTQVNV